MKRFNWPEGFLLIIACVLLYFSISTGRGQGIDSGRSAAETMPLLKDFIGGSLHWIRLRGVKNVGDLEGVADERRNLRSIRKAGGKVCVLVRIDPVHWVSGVRPIKGSRLPLDLREAFRWAAQLGLAYGDLVDAWEIDNEPDVGFMSENAETYTAFLKATSIGFDKGASRLKAVPAAAWRCGFEDLRTFSALGLETKMRPLGLGKGLMAPLALPPGPYLERLLANGILSYTAGINFHYYGYEEDFSSVYRQFENAIVSEPNAANGQIIGYTAPESRTMPIFITEYGYGSLSGQLANTREGRIRQWRWFRSVEQQALSLEIEGMMAFVMPPYFEYGIQEFGLSMKRPLDTPHPSRYMAGGLQFVPQDFNISAAAKWMDVIGHPLGENDVSPALAWLLAGKPFLRSSRSWTVSEIAASPVVIDFIAENATQPVKALQGYALVNKGDGASIGNGLLRIYNFGDTPITGILELGASARVSGQSSLFLTLLPGELREESVELSIADRVFRPHDCRILFMPLTPGIAASFFSTLLYPDVRDMARKVMVALEGGRIGARNLSVLQDRHLASEEPVEKPFGRWLVTNGVSVSEQQKGWSFKVSGFPDQPLRPAVAELILPDDFTFPDLSLLEFKYRLLPRDSMHLRTSLEPQAPSAGLGSDEESVRVYWRAANGNLYTVWSTPSANTGWQRYAQAKESFTMAFYGRANLPWRFNDNKLVALVFQFRPIKLPAVYEIKDPVLTSYSK